MKPTNTAIILAYNVEETIGEVVSSALHHVDKVIVIDDGDTNDTSPLAEEANAEVIRNLVKLVKRRSMLRGYKAVHSDIEVRRADPQRPSRSRHRRMGLIPVF